MNFVCVVFLKKNWMFCNVVNGLIFLRERENLQNSMLKCGISILNDWGLEEEYLNKIF